jgi:hypothetical protein
VRKITIGTFAYSRISKNTDPLKSPISDGHLITVNSDVARKVFIVIWENDGICSSLTFTFDFFRLFGVPSRTGTVDNDDARAPLVWAFRIPQLHALIKLFKDSILTNKEGCGRLLFVCRVSS